MPPRPGGVEIAAMVSQTVSETGIACIQFRGIPYQDTWAWPYRRGAMDCVAVAKPVFDFSGLRRGYSPQSKLAGNVGPDGHGGGDVGVRRV